MSKTVTVFEITITPKAKRDLVHLNPHEKIAVQDALNDIKENATTESAERKTMSKRGRYWIFRQRLTCGFIMYHVLIAGNELTNKVVITMLTGFQSNDKKAASKAH
jgi:hypothetical protein